MSSSTLLYIFLGGGLGAVVRYIVSFGAQNNFTGNFPFGTLTVNLIGCFIIGLLWQWFTKHPEWNALILIGFLGGFTTFSTFGLDGYKMLQAQAFTPFLLYVSISNIAGLGLVFIGNKLSHLIS